MDGVKNAISKKSEEIVIWGASGHAMVVADILRLMGGYEILGFIDNENHLSHHTNFCGAPIIGGEEQLDVLLEKGVKNMTLGFGDCASRLLISAHVRQKGFTLVSAIHPRSIVANDVQIGAGTVVAAGAVVNPCSTIGENVIINTCASIDHECMIEDGCHISPGVHMAGNVIVGRGSWIGIGATVKDQVRIGAGSIIGAGAVVLSDIPENTLAYGVPARIVNTLSHSSAERTSKHFYS
ncbi:MAG TPA: acetyltransferase [Syntrophorhabdaceae bacterium]|jgi:acetyltransferase EpsM